MILTYIKEMLRKAKEFVMNNSYIKTFGLIAGITIIIIIFIIKSIFNTEISNLYKKIKEQNITQENGVLVDEYIKLVNQGISFENELKYEKAIECYRDAVKFLDSEKEKVEMANCISQIGVLSLNCNNTMDAVKYFDESWNLVQDIEISKDNYYDICDIYSNVAVGKIHYNEFQEALLIYKNILSIYDEMNDVCSEKRALVYDDLANLYYKLGNAPYAISYIEKACEIIEDTLGNDNLKSAKVYGTVCLVYSDINYEKARLYGEKAYKIIIESNTQNNWDIISICQSLSYLYKNTDSSKSRQYALERYEYSKLFFGEMHTDTILSQMELASYESNEKRVAILEELNKKAVSRYGETAIETAIVWNNLANAYMNIYKEEEAKELYLKCLNIFVNLLGNEHPYVASVYYDLALWAKNAGEYFLQLSYAEEAQKIYRNRYGEMYFEVAGLYLVIGDAEFMYSGDYNKSLHFYEDAKKIYIGLYGENNILVAQCDKKRANVYIAQHDLNTAEELVHSCKDKYEYEYGSTCVEMAEVLILQSQINLYGKKFDLAINDANRVIDICKLYGRENSLFASGAYYILCNCYLEKKDWESVCYYAQKAINVIEMNGSNLHTIPEYIGSYSFLAISYSTNAEYEELAVDSIETTLELSKLCNNINIKIQAYYDAATVYNNLGIKDVALDYVNEAYSMAMGVDEFNPNLESISILKRKILCE